MKASFYTSIFLVIALLAVYANAGLDAHEEEEPVPKKKSAAWDYEPNIKGFLSPDEWYKSYPQCAGRQQSPIDIQVNNTVYDENLKKVVINYEQTLEDELYGDHPYDITWTMQNNGKTVTFDLAHGQIETIFEYEKFLFQQMHFHWNTSEHAVNGKHHTAELHLVHKSLNDENKYAVLGFFFQITPEDNPDLMPIIKKLARNKHEFRKHIVNFDLESIVPFEVSNFYRYMGSLTTPNCMEGINWYVVAKPILGISQRQLDVFQNLHTDHQTKLLYNARPIQQLYDRSIRRSWDRSFRKHKLPAKSSSTKLNIMNLSFVLTLLASFFH